MSGGVLKGKNDMEMMSDLGTRTYKEQGEIFYLFFNLSFICISSSKNLCLYIFKILFLYITYIMYLTVNYLTCIDIL